MDLLFQSLSFKKLSAKDYIKFSKQILKNCKNKHVSLEIIADDDVNAIRQGKILQTWEKCICKNTNNVYQWKINKKCYKGIGFRKY